jgi:5'-3' exonuclease
VPPELLSQFPILEDALQAMGVLVWPMLEYEADDALASASNKAAQEDRIRKVFIRTPDKDLGECVSGTRVVQLDRRRNVVRDEAGIVEKFGVTPESIPDFLAVVGKTADGCPGIAGWVVKAAASCCRTTTTWKVSPRIGRNGEVAAAEVANSIAHI